MSDVFMCDCCGEIFDVDERNEMSEELDAYWGAKFTARDDVCDECLDDIMNKMGYVEEKKEGFWSKLWKRSRYFLRANTKS